MTDNIFRRLEESEDYFAEFVGNHLRNAPSALSPVLNCEINVDGSRLSYAHTAYVQGVQKFALYLQSGDPDHFKRAGALLHAIYTSQPIDSVQFDPDLEDVDTISTPLGVSYGDAEGALSFGHFFREYHNEFLGFQLSFDICRQYLENDPREIDFEYVHTVCTYLKNNGNLSVESLFMIYKSLLD